MPVDVPEFSNGDRSRWRWLLDHPNDAMVRLKLADLQRDPRFAEPDEPDDIMPQVPELAEFPVPPRLRKYIDATRIVAGASVPTSAACIGAASSSAPAPWVAGTTSPTSTS